MPAKKSVYKIAALGILSVISVIPVAHAKLQLDPDTPDWEIPIFERCTLVNTDTDQGHKERLVLFVEDCELPLKYFENHGWKLIANETEFITLEKEKDSLK
jgi:hypothetical protein